jgi:hypothetical protein
MLDGADRHATTFGALPPNARALGPAGHLNAKKPYRRVNQAAQPSP